ncbi:MAG: hypothetical protein Q8K99_06485 [Actinomycetota bacterium]|nr:hypothetical protein [Actinomycetota bacterium]
MKKLVVVSILIVAVVFGLVAYATADTVVYPGAGAPNQSASGSVTVRAVVNPKLTLSLTTPDAAQTLDFGSLNPGDDPAAKAVGILVSSNKAFAIDKAVAGNDLVTVFGMTMSYAPGLGVATGAKGQNVSFTDSYDIPAVAWTVNPGTYVDTVTYTVTQN